MNVETKNKNRNKRGKAYEKGGCSLLHVKRNYMHLYSSFNCLSLSYHTIPGERQLVFIPGENVLK